MLRRVARCPSGGSSSAAPLPVRAYQDPKVLLLGVPCFPRLHSDLLCLRLLRQRRGPCDHQDATDLTAGGGHRFGVTCSSARPPSHRRAARQRLIVRRIAFVRIDGGFAGILAGSGHRQRWGDLNPNDVSWRRWCQQPPGAHIDSRRTRGLPRLALLKFTTAVMRLWFIGAVLAPRRLQLSRRICLSPFLALQVCSMRGGSVRLRCSRALRGSQRGC
jgi:hypothetical protein